MKKTSGLLLTTTMLLSVFLSGVSSLSAEEHSSVIRDSSVVVNLMAGADFQFGAFDNKKGLNEGVYGRNGMFYNTFKTTFKVSRGLGSVDDSHYGLVISTATLQKRLLDIESGNFMLVGMKSGNGVIEQPLHEYGDFYSFGADVSTTTPRDTATQTVLLKKMRPQEMYMHSITDSYAFIGAKDFGELRLGNTADAAVDFRVGADKIATATGGIGGDWVLYANLDGDMTTLYSAVDTSAVTGDDQQGKPVNPCGVSYLAKPYSFIENGEMFSDIRTPKIFYSSPSFGGFVFGVSYTASNADSARTFKRFSDSKNAYQNILSGGLKYENDFLDDLLHVNAAVTGEYAKNDDDVRFNRMKTWNFGATVGYSGFQVSFSAGDWAETGMKKDLYSDIVAVPALTKTQDPSETSYWTLGAAYGNDRSAVSVTFMESDRAQPDASGGTANLKNLSVGGQYALTGCIKPYAEVSVFKTEDASYHTKAFLSTESKPVDNKGFVFLVGMKVDFNVHTS